MTSAYLLVIPVAITMFCCAQAFGFMDSEAKITFSPIEHASFVIQADKITIYVDPVGDAKEYAKFKKPDIILITHNHYDHLSVELVNIFKQKETVVIGPKAVIDEIGTGVTMKNGAKIQIKDINIEATPMYNTTKERLQFHAKGNGNGYVLTINNKRIYISGDTEDIPQMRALRDIDYAFVCMNLPYTMSVEQAASAVLEFKPKVVFPYHYRGAEGMSDLEKFKKLVSENKSIKVSVLDWY